MTQTIEVKVKTTSYPTTWKTAKECRETANSWENEEIKSCVDSLMTKVWAKANEGGTFIVCAVRTGRPKHFYEVLEKIFKDLGYSVTVPTEPWYDNCASKNWVFKW